MLKKVMFFAIFSIVLLGCTSNKQYELKTNNSTNSTVQSSFNEETYIWENWIFPSNKTTGK